MASTDVAKTVALIEISTSYSDVAHMLGKSKSTIYRNVRRWRQKREYVRRRSPSLQGSLCLRLFECGRNKNNGEAGMFSRH